MKTIWYSLCAVGMALLSAAAGYAEKPDLVVETWDTSSANSAVFSRDGKTLQRPILIGGEGAQYH